MAASEENTPKYRKSIFKCLSNFSTCSNLLLVLLSVIMAVLVYYIKHISHEIQVFEPFSILGLEPGVSDSEIKKAYRRLSIQYHPDKNPDPGRCCWAFSSEHTQVFAEVWIYKLLAELEGHALYLDRLISCLHMALPFFTRGASSNRFLNYLNKNIVPDFDKVENHR
ncbi:DnaJ protein ERDJ2 [Camellia lanceoleosa]|uniref:DnaJ protein ERDJ2 n=1 Tax=Camellia lanceoleosa TaxID=1840588 RepID=A0ACC0GDR8_9ERIC|nr:DnaJ protein ERDJ2 [Camellia lanceoleosa]